MVTDGPFAETKEAVGGFYVVDCASRDEAIELAGRVREPRRRRRGAHDRRPPAGPPDAAAVRGATWNARIVFVQVVVATSWYPTARRRTRWPVATFERAMIVRVVGPPSGLAVPSTEQVPRWSVAPARRTGRSPCGQSEERSRDEGVQHRMPTRAPFSRRSSRNAQLRSTARPPRVNVDRVHRS